MRILVVAATDAEIAPVVSALGTASGRTPWASTYKLGDVDIYGMVTGVGMVATTAWTTRALCEGRHDFALNVGLCGTLDPAIALGTVVHVVSDRLVEMGAEDGDRF